MLTDTVWTIVCTFGLVLAAWWCMTRFVPPVPGRRTRAVLAGRGDGSDLEHTVRSLVRLRSLGIWSCPIIIANVDLSQEGQEVALRLARRWPDVILWPADDLAACISEF